MKQNPKGHEYEYHDLKPSEIVMDTTYQRHLDATRVSKIANEFNGDIFNAPKVSYRDGRYYCFDGQQSTAAWDLYHNNDDTPVECKVFYGMTWEDEVDAFVAQTGFSRAIAQAMKLRAMYNRGDHDVVNMVTITENLGWKIDFLNAKGTAKNKISAVASLYRAYKSLGMEAFTDMMTAIREAWDGDPDSTTTQILTGMKGFYKAYYGHFDHDELVSSLKGEAPIKIIRNGKANHYYSKNAYAYQILLAYNNRRRRGKLEDKFA